jgi:hypothetical protein
MHDTHNVRFEDTITDPDTGDQIVVSGSSRTELDRNVAAVFGADDDGTALGDNTD